MKPTRPVHLHIDELLLAGFPAGERYRIQEAVQLALAEMIASGTFAPPSGATSRAIEAVVPQTINFRGARGTSAIGAGIAQSVLGSVVTALGGSAQARPAGAGSKQ
jgi:hypothetical protein